MTSASVDKGPKIKGWCPGALRPMLSGDGWVVRVRPYGGVLLPAQVDGLAALAVAHGNGMFDVSARGNIQMRGVREASHTPLIEGLRALSLVDADANVEGRRNVLVTPFRDVGDETALLAAVLTDALAAADAPDLPGKFGFAIDTGRSPVLQTASADIRLERDVDGGVILVQDGCDLGKSVTVETATAEVIALAHWFMDTSQSETRMARLIDNTPDLPPGFDIPRQTQTYVPKPGRTPYGALVALAFGQVTSQTLATLAKHGGLRMTPWRMVLVEDAADLPEIDGIITDPADPLLRVVACTGAPGCTQGLGRTRDLVRTLAPHVPTDQTLHVSGCTKGCAHPAVAPLTVTATTAGYDLIRDGTAADTPEQTNLTPDTLIKAI
jgi:precorrin-3B synthase